MSDNPNILLDEGSPLGEGWLTGKPAAEDGADAARMAEVFGVDDDDEGAWNVGPKAKETPAPEAPTEADDDALAARYGVDRRDLAEFLGQHEGLPEQLVAQGFITAEPKTAAEVAANVLALDKLRGQVAQVQAVRQQALAEALEDYEVGEDPAEIADRLLTEHGADVAGAFINQWHADDVDYDEEPETPETALDWITQKSAVARLMDEARLYQAREELAGAEAARDEEAGQAQKEAMAEIRRRTDYTKPVQKAMVEMLDKNPGAYVVDGPDEGRAAMWQLFAAAKELAGASSRAEMTMGLEEQLHYDNGWLSGKEWKPFDPEEAFNAALVKGFNLERAVTVPATRAEREAELRGQLAPTDDETALADAFSTIERTDYNPRRVEDEARKRGYRR